MNKSDIKIEYKKACWKILETRARSNGMTQPTHPALLLKATLSKRAIEVVLCEDGDMFADHYYFSMEELEEMYQDAVHDLEILNKDLTVH